MNENLVGYLLKALDDDSQLAVERHLRTDPDAPRQLELLRRALAPLDADATPPEPPSGLRFRTLAVLAEHTCREREPVAAAPMPPPHTLPMPRRHWRRPDVLVAAAVILVSFSMVPSAVVNVTRYRDRAYCQNNLRELHRALMGYSGDHGGYLPKVETQPPGNFAGVFVPILHSTGHLNENTPVMCASIKQPSPRRLTWEQLRQLPQAEVDLYLQEARDLYAYSMGHFDGGRQLVGIRRAADNDLLPILADSPPFIQHGADVRLAGNSRNHGGTGQNVLRLGGNVDFCTNRFVGSHGKDDIYLNDHGEVAAGLHPRDMVLGASAARPVLPD